MAFLKGKTIKNSPNQRILNVALKLRLYRPLRIIHTNLFRRKAFRTDLRFFQGILRPGCLVFDVGANRGQSAEIFLLAGANVVAYEPQANLHSEILQRCKGRGSFRLESYALGKSEGRRRLYLRHFDQIASMRRDWDGKIIDSVDVGVSTLDLEILKHGKPYYCKIDVEGWEREVLAGLSTEVPLISIEYHLTEKEIPNTVGALERLGAIGDYECNIRVSGSTGFRFENFRKITEFRNFFAQYASENAPSEYGEVFAKLRGANNNQ